MAEHKELDRKVIELGKQVVRMCTEAGSGHPSSALSILHLTAGLMYRVMRYDPKNPWNTGSDRLVLSEGHAVPIVYAAYCDLGGVVGSSDQPSQLRFDDALTLREADSVLDGHPNPAVGFPFFDAATGSLGQGLSVAAGLALAARSDGSDKKIFCLIGDGESREGQIWEAVDFIVEQKLTAVRAIFNCNGQGQSENVSPQQSADVLAAKCEAFGMAVKIIDGHNWDEVLEALTAEAADKPLAIIAKTVKGWGVNELQGQNYHGKPLEAEQVEQALADLEAKAAELGAGDLADRDISELQSAEPVGRPAPGELSAGSFAEALQAVGLEKALEDGKLATRRAYGAALAALGADPRVVALDGDVKNSTFAEYFAGKHPDRYFEGRIAEQNMISAAAGLSAAGRVPFVSSFGKFLLRGYDQIEMAAISNANVKLVGSHVGVSLAADGPSQMALPDLAFMRSFAHSTRVDGAPAIRLFLPSDAVSAFKLTELMANTDGLCYMRTHRPDVEFLYGEDEAFELGGFKHLVDGEDVLIVASGYMVHIAKQAMAILDEQFGLSASLVDAYCLPLKTEEILQIGDDCRGQVLVVEDNYVGGVSDEIASAAARSDLGVCVESLVVRRVPKSAKTPEEILKMVHLTAEDIASAAQSMFDRSE
ncbi:MAG: transketolase [Planctomycetota bacterium]|jgi:transketolase